MKPITVDELAKFLGERGWASLHAGELVLPASATKRSGFFETDGIVGVEFSEIFLNKVLPAQIDSGILYVRGFNALDLKQAYSPRSHISGLARRSMRSGWLPDDGVR